MPIQYITTNVRLPKPLHKALKLRAVEEEKSFAELIRDALDECYVNSYSTKRKKTSIMVGNKKIETLADLAQLAKPMGGDLSSNIDALVYGNHRVIELAQEQQPV